MRQNPIQTNNQSRRSALVAVLVLTIAVGTPSGAQAFSLWDMLIGAANPIVEAASPSLPIHNLLTPALRAVTNPNLGSGGGDIIIIDFVALIAESGPEGTIADIEEKEASSDQISLYVVRKGDTLLGIAKMFDVSVNTILWANDLKSSRDIRPGDQLVILPISGVKHTLVKGETLVSVVKKYKGDMDEVLAFNRLEPGAKMAVGDVLVIPNGVESVPVAVRAGFSAVISGFSGPSIPGYYVRPMQGRKSQGLHGHNGVDIAAPVGTLVIASANGTVTVARGHGWNGGYGQYIVVSHGNGTQTVYAHLSSVIVQQGASVVQGQVIGYSGNTGRSTGPHLHFEVRGAKNPF